VIDCRVVVYLSEKRGKVLRKQRLHSGRPTLGVIKSIQQGLSLTRNVFKKDKRRWIKKGKNITHG